MRDTIYESIELLETAFSEKDWELVLLAIQLLNEIPDLPSEEGEELESFEDDEL